MRIVELPFASLSPAPWISHEHHFYHASFPFSLGFQAIADFSLLISWARCG
jgi:hypothetical protein